MPQVLLDALESAHQVAYSEKALPVGWKKTDSGKAMSNDSYKRPSSKPAEVNQCTVFILPIVICTYVYGCECRL